MRGHSRRRGKKGRGCVDGASWFPAHSLSLAIFPYHFGAIILGFCANSALQHSVRAFATRDEYLTARAVNPESQALAAGGRYAAEWFTAAKAIHSYAADSETGAPAPCLRRTCRSPRATGRAVPAS